MNLSHRLSIFYVRCHYSCRHNHSRAISACLVAKRANPSPRSLTIQASLYYLPGPTSDAFLVFGGLSQRSNDRHNLLQAPWSAQVRVARRKALPFFDTNRSYRLVCAENDDRAAGRLLSSKDPPVHHARIDAALAKGHRQGENVVMSRHKFINNFWQALDRRKPTVSVRAEALRRFWRE
jgi:hypothetical protein